MTETASSRGEVRATIVAAAAKLLQEHGPSAVTTRGVAERAGVQAPTIYRLFGDKDGLLDAVAEYVMATYVSAKAEVVRAASEANVDPVDELRAGWRMQIEFGLANPTLFRLLSEPDRVRDSPAAQSGRQVLEMRVHRIALSGRLRLSEQRAVALIQAAGIGVIQTLLATPPDERDAALADEMFDAVLRRIVSDTPALPESGHLAAAVVLRAVAPDLDMLSDAERAVLTEWLDRIIAAR